MHLSYALRRFALRAPNARAIVDADGRAWTRRELVDRIFGVGNALEGIGLRRGDRVALLHEDDRRYIECEYGIMASGLVRVPLDPRLERDRLLAHLADCGARALVVSARYAERGLDVAQEHPDLTVLSTAAARQGLRDLDGLLGRASTAAPTCGNDADLASLNYTGGTTGQPRAVMLTHRALLTVVANTLVARPVTSQDVFLNVRPIWPISGIALLIQLLGGATIALAGSFDAESFWQAAGRFEATATTLVPTHLVRLLDRRTAPVGDATRLRSIDVGGAAIPPDLFLEALDRFGPRFGVIYGLTEAPWTCYLPPASLAPAERRGHLVRTVGHEMFGYRVTIVAPSGDPVATGETGEIVIEGDHLMSGYWGRAQATREVLSEGRFRSGDLGRLDDEGYLSVVGRTKEVIRSGASTVLPQEVEHALLQHAAVAEAAVVGVPDREWGEVVKAFVVLRPGVSATEQEIIEHCSARLARYMKPKVVEFVGELPRSHYGKVLKAKLIDADVRPSPKIGV